MDKEQAINIVKQALNAATLKGVYSLEDAGTILQAIAVLETKKIEK